MTPKRIAGWPLPTQTFVALTTLALAACGAAPRRVETATSAPVATAHQISDAEARAAIASLDELRAQQICIAPGVCEDMSEWVPTGLLVLDQQLVAIGGAHVFVRAGDHWTHFALPGDARGGMATNGHSAFFVAGAEIYELTTQGIRTRATLPYWAEGCDSVAVSGDELYVVVSPDDLMLHLQDGFWKPLAFEARGNAGRLAMTRSHAFVMGDGCHLFELPSAGPSFEPRSVAELDIGDNCSMRVATDQASTAERVVVVSQSEHHSAIAIVENGVAWSSPFPGSAPRARRGEGYEEPMTEPDGDPEGDPDAEPSDAERAAAAERQSQRELAGLRQHFAGRGTLIGLAPPMIEQMHVVGGLVHARNTQGESSTSVMIAPQYFVLENEQWTEREIRAEPVPLVMAMHFAAVIRDERALATNYGPFRLDLLMGRPSGPGGQPGGAGVIARVRDGMEPVLSLLPVAGHGRLAAPAAGEDMTDLCHVAQAPDSPTFSRCGPPYGGVVIRWSGGRAAEDGRRVAGPQPESALEVLSEDRRQVVLRHTSRGRFGAYSAASRERLFVADPQRGLGMVDSAGWHAIPLPSGETAQHIYSTPGGLAYVLTARTGGSSGTNSKLFLVRNGVARVLANPGFDLRSYSWPRSDEDFYRLVEGVGVVRIHDGVLEHLSLPAGATATSVMESADGAVMVLGSGGTTWLVHHGALFEAVAPTLDAERSAAQRYYRPAAGIDAPWTLSFTAPGDYDGTPAYRTVSPTLRSLGAVTSTPLPPVGASTALVTLSRDEGARRALRTTPLATPAELSTYLDRCRAALQASPIEDEEGEGEGEGEGDDDARRRNRAQQIERRAIRAYCAALFETNADHPRDFARQLTVVADETMENVVLTTNDGGGSGEDGRHVGHFVALVDRSPTTPLDREDRQAHAALATTLMTAPGLALVPFFALTRAASDTGTMAGMVVHARRGGELLRVRVEGPQLVIEIINRGNSTATLVARQPLPTTDCSEIGAVAAAWMQCTPGRVNVLVRGTAAISADGRRVALAIHLQRPGMNSTLAPLLRVLALPEAREAATPR